MSKDNVNLPKTAFSMKANLQNKEPGLIDFWDKIELYKKLRSSSKGKEKFVLHDGPPYANGNIHMGTALNKILKDLIVKFHQMSGKDSVYVPGWNFFLVSSNGPEQTHILPANPSAPIFLCDGGPIGTPFISGFTLMGTATATDGSGGYGAGP